MCLYKIYSQLISIFLLTCFNTVSFSQPNTTGKIPPDKIKTFQSKLEAIRVTLKIPALSAAIMQGEEIVWAKGFGYADVENKIPATENTSYRIASVTKTFTSTLIMQLVEKGKLDLNNPISSYGLSFDNDKNIRVKHLLTNTSEGKAGTRFQYNGYRFGRLGIVAEKASGKPFYELLIENILQPLEMTSTAPDIPLYEYYKYTQKNQWAKASFDKAFTSLAKPYELNDSSQIIASQYLNEFGAFGGLLSTVKDILKYSAAIDRNQFLSKQTQTTVFTPTITSTNEVSPYGLGWFVEKYKGVDFYWHYGQTKAESALFVKVPSLKLSLVVLANTDKLSQPFALGDGDLLLSPVGQLFYKSFVNDDSSLLNIDYSASNESIIQTLAKRKTSSSTYDDFYNKEVITNASMYRFSNPQKSKELYKLYYELNKGNRPAFTSQPVLAEIAQVEANQDLAKEFRLTKATKVRVYAVGENCSFDCSEWCDYGWIENIDNQTTIWGMNGKPCKPAGGANKNQFVTTVIDLPEGNYRLHYKSDYAHSYNNWDALPPTHSFYGIAVYIEP